MTKTKIQIKNTRFPTLTRAVLKRLDREQLADVARHGADAGFSGFTYYSGTVPFFKRHRVDILKMAEEMADDFGQGVLEMVAGFRCLDKKYTIDEIGRALFSTIAKDDASGMIRNAMTWFALEEVARELNPDV